MIRDAPVKFRIMEVFEEGGPQWNYEVVPKIMEEYGMHSHHEQQMVNYDIIEMVSAGFLEEGESVIDEEGSSTKDTSSPSTRSLPWVSPPWTI